MASPAPHPQMARAAEPTPAELRAALEWLVRLNDDRAPPGLRGKFETWLDGGPERQMAWDEANALWSGLEPVKAGIETLRQRDRALGRRQVLGGLASAAVLGAGGWHVSRPWFNADFTTAAGETREITLADGSGLSLGSRSAVDLDFAGEQRGIRLLRGEVFVVAAPLAQPFRVTVPGGRVQSAAARFNVHLAPGRVDVGVAENRLTLLPEMAPQVELLAGQISGFQGQGTLPLRAVDPALVGAWRQGRLVFRSTPLGEVLSEIERWRGGYIALRGADLAQIPVTAIFDTSAPGMALDTIVETLGLARFDLPGGLTFIHAG